MRLSIDLNADLGEGAGHDEELFELISSANIATGFHAGDSDSMHAAVSAAKKHGVAVGAHPSFFDRENFGRKELKVSNQEVFDAVVYQLGVFQAIASAVGVQPSHVKPHGALYNMAVRDEKLADAIARAIESVDPKLILFAPDNTELARAGEAHGLQVAREIFADRNYLNDGWLVPRTRPDALLHDPKEAAQRVLRMLREGKVRSVEGRDVEVCGETICVHGDTPGAVEFARELRSRLEHEGVRITAPKRMTKSEFRMPTE
jgi:5-oxoprolinase (ATP-hydrolysing) subunit A